MASGFSAGGGAPDFYTRSITNMNTNNHHPSQQQPSFRTNPTHHHLSQIFLDQSTSQIAQQRAMAATNGASSLIGKRTLADFQQHHPSLNPALNGLLHRSVKPRMYHHHQQQQHATTSPISTLSPIEFSAHLSSELPSLSQRYGLPLLQQLRPQPPIGHQTLPYVNALHQQSLRGGGLVGVGQDPEKKMMNRLQELEKELLDDNDEVEGDAVSAITNSNSEWSETIQTLFSSSSANSNPPVTAPSPTSSSSSTSSSTTVTTPVPNCSKQTLIEAASAISEGKTDIATEILTRVSQASNTRGNSEQRLMEYMSSALKSRVNPVENPPPVAEIYSMEHVASTHFLYEISPCFNLGFMAANLAILDATLDQQPTTGNSFHVIDFDIGQGKQYVHLLYALFERQKGKPAIVKITAVADNGAEENERLGVVRDRLSQRAAQLGVSLQFNVATCSKLSDLTRDSLGCQPDEPVAVNLAFKLYRMPDESVSTENPRDELLRRVKGLAPRVVTLLEQEMNANTAPFMARVNETCAYYGALLESIDSMVARDNGERMKVEGGLGRKLANSVACEGRDRVERCEVFGKWRARMGMAGFELKPVGENVAESLKSQLGSTNPGFTVKEENGGICLGWKGKTLTVASAWR